MLRKRLIADIHWQLHSVHFGMLHVTNIAAIIISVHTCLSAMGISKLLISNFRCNTPLLLLLPLIMLLLLLLLRILLLPVVPAVAVQAR